jgi:DNA-binding transcriptional LysR family regulator
MRSLDLDQLRTFVVVAELRSFTAAGDCLNATQSAVSLRIAKLEAQVGRPLLARTPRAVSLTPDGTRFLDHARAILAAHDAALSQLAEPAGAGQAAIRLAVSDHAAGAGLAAALSSLKASLPGQAWDVTVGLSAEMRDLYDGGGADAAIVRQDAAERRSGEPLFDDPLVWAAAPGLDPAGAVPLVALRGPCGVTAAATGALDAAGRPWRYAFLGGSVLALQAAVRAGLGVGAFGRRHVPAGAGILGDREGLPGLPLARVVMHTRLTGRVRRALTAAFQAAGG